MKVLDIINEEIQRLNQNFWQWFGNSKVVDRYGKPLIVYHGTRQDFDAFESNSFGSHFGTRKQAEYIVRDRIGRNTMPIYLSIQNPFPMPDVTTEDNHPHLLVDYLKGEEVDGMHSEFILNPTELKEIEKILPPDDVLPNIKLQAEYAVVMKKIKEILMQHGYDGAVYNNTVEGVANKHKGNKSSGKSWIAFKPEQIKSASGNNGEWSPNTGNIVREEISEFNKTVFTELPDELFQRLRLRKFSDEANRQHMKIFKAKDGRDYLVKKEINQDIFHVYRLDNLNFPVATAVFDVQNDYFSGYESSQSIKVEPQFRRLGMATAMTDFAENIYNLPYKPTKLLSEPMQGFVKNRFA